MKKLQDLMKKKYNTELGRSSSRITELSGYQGRLDDAKDLVLKALVKLKIKLGAEYPFTFKANIKSLKSPVQLRSTC